MLAGYINYDQNQIIPFVYFSFIHSEADKI